MKRIKIKGYLKDLSLAILGVLIALLIDNYRENIRDEKIVRSYVDIVAEDLNFDIISLTDQLKIDSVHADKLKLLNSILALNPKLPDSRYSLSSWTELDSTVYRNLDKWDSLDYYTRYLYSSSSYKTRQIGFSTIVNSGLSHQIPEDLLKKITIYYTTDSHDLDFYTDIDEKCLWVIIPYLNQYQGFFKDRILSKDFDASMLRNHVGGRHNTMRNEMWAKKLTIEKARELLSVIESK